MILCDHQIKMALRERQLIIDPMPDESQIQSTSIDLHVGDGFKRWCKSLSAKGVDASIDLDDVELTQLLQLMEDLEPVDGVVPIRPGDFVLVRTLENVCLALKSKLAARVEGRSKQARLGMGVHITAPTIHAGFEGRIAQEIVNHGPFTLKVRPNQSKLCQLIIERVGAVPKQKPGQFSGQTTPLGTPVPEQRSGTRPQNPSGEGQQRRRGHQHRHRQRLRRLSRATIVSAVPASEFTLHYSFMKLIT
jgi:dCTP deaminase